MSVATVLALLIVSTAMIIGGFYAYVQLGVLQGETRGEVGKLRSEVSADAQPVGAPRRVHPAARWPPTPWSKKSIRRHHLSRQLQPGRLARRAEGDPGRLPRQCESPPGRGPTDFKARASTPCPSSDRGIARPPRTQVRVNRRHARPHPASTAEDRHQESSSDEFAPPVPRSWVARVFRPRDGATVALAVARLAVASPGAARTALDPGDRLSSPTAGETSRSPPPGTFSITGYARGHPSAARR